MEPAAVVELRGENGAPRETLGATKMYPQDRSPLMVTKISKSGKTIDYVTVRSVGGDTGHSPARYDGDWPVWDHDYSSRELRRLAIFNGSVRTARWSEKNGCYMDNGAQIKVGVANYHRNYSY